MLVVIYKNNFEGKLTTHHYTYRSNQHYSKDKMKGFTLSFLLSGKEPV